jgi:2-(3-amino-3-carboxypropyl)histidine synthase
MQHDLESIQYDLELNKAVAEIKNTKAKTVCIQLPDGLKAKADEIVTFLEQETGAQVLIWLNSCYGACDWPLGLDVDILIAWGHSAWKSAIPEKIE